MHVSRLGGIGDQGVLGELEPEALPVDGALRALRDESEKGLRIRLVQRRAGSGVADPKRELVAGCQACWGSRAVGDRRAHLGGRSAADQQRTEGEQGKSTK